MAAQYPKMSKQDIESLANKIIEVLCKKELAGDMCVYFNNKRISVCEKFDKDFNCTYKISVEEEVNPHDYFDCAYAHIISLSTEGGLYDRLNMGLGFPDELESLFKYWGIYHEQWDSWNLSFYPVDEDEGRIEFTHYLQPIQPMCIALRWGYDPTPETPAEFIPIMKEWWKRSAETGDSGCCVLGAQLHFIYKGTPYQMSACSPCQTEGSWLPHVEWVKEELGKLGATNFFWDCGRMD